MKYMVISDIHGDIYNLNTVLDIFKKENCNKLIILGDLFNYGIDLNRNDIIDRLNILRDNLIYVRGNCDNNINGILFDTPYSLVININNKKAFLNHGHLYNKEYLLGSDYDIIISGHSHIANVEYINDKLFLNPGSISKSRMGENSFMIIDKNLISIRNLNNKIIYEKEVILNENIYCV